MVKISASTDSHGLPGIMCDTVLSLDCVAWKSRHVGQFLTVSYVGIHVDPVDGSSSFLCPKFMYSWLSTFPWSDAGIIILLPCMMIPSFQFHLQMTSMAVDLSISQLLLMASDSYIF